MGAEAGAAPIGSALMAVGRPEVMAASTQPFSNLYPYFCQGCWGHFRGFTLGLTHCAAFQFHDRRGLCSVAPHEQRRQQSKAYSLVLTLKSISFGIMLEIQF